jgi:HK97 gp10 family phage protein
MPRPRNLSVEQLQQLFAKIPESVAAEFANAPIEEGERLAGVMRSAVAKGIDGRNELLQSIRVEPGRRPLQALVKAGGPLTTRAVRKGSGVTYDYSLANEFGTRKMKAQPFFWPSYRLMKKRIRTSLNKRMKAAIGKVVPLK